MGGRAVSTVRRRAQRNVLVLDDNATDCELLSAILSPTGYDCACCSDPEQAFELLASGQFAVLLSDYHLGPVNGVSVSRQVRERHPEVAVVLVTGDERRSTAIDALRAGVFDFVEKTCDVEAFRQSVLSALERAFAPGRRAPTGDRRAARQLARAEGAATDCVVGDSAEIQRVRRLAKSAARVDAPVWIWGEPGIERQALAELIHSLGPHRDRQLERVRCETVTDGDQLSSLLSKRREPVATLHLDEVGSLAPPLLTQLLCGLTPQPGSDRGGPRLIVSSSEPPCDADQRGESTLIQIMVPALRHRRRDIPALVEHFLDEARLLMHSPFLRFSPHALEVLSLHDWPGNVDELRDCVRHAASLSTSSVVRVSDLPPHVSASLKSQGSAAVQVMSLEEMERQYIEQVLGAVAGNKAAAARLLRVDRTTLYRKLQTRPAAAGRSR